MQLLHFIHENETKLLVLAIDRSQVRVADIVR